MITVKTIGKILDLLDSNFVRCFDDATRLNVPMNLFQKKIEPQDRHPELSQCPRPKPGT